MSKALIWCCAVVLGSSFLLVPTFTLGQDAAKKLDELKAYPDLIVVNGKILTMNDRNPQAQAMAVRNNRILAMGNDDEIRFLVGPQTEILDVKGRTVLPGLIDTHQHLQIHAAQRWLGVEGDSEAKKFNDPQLQIFYAMGNNQTDVRESLERIVRERATTLGPGKWIWVGLFAGSNLEESRKVVGPLFRSLINREYLDELAPNNPLAVFATELGPAAHNTKAKEQMMKYWGYETDSPNGIAFDLLLRGRVEAQADLLQQEMSGSLAPQGVTTIGTQYWGTPSIMKAYNFLYQRGELPVRWAWYFDVPETYHARKATGTPSGQAEDDADAFLKDLGDFRGIGNDYIWNAGVSDEGWEQGLQCTTAEPLKTQPLAVDSQLPHTAFGACSPTTDYEKIKGYRDVRTALEAGLRISFLHTYSDGTYEALFHMLDREIADGKMTLDEVRQIRITTEHNPLIRPDLVPTIAKFGIIPSFTMFRIQGNTPGALFLKQFGDRYVSWVAPVKSLVDAGVHPVLATDAPLGKLPVHALVVDLPEQWINNLWAFLEFFVTRTIPGNPMVFNRNEAVDRMTMLKMATIWGAEALLNEKNVGSLEVGKLADFIVIDKDFVTVPENQIHTIKTLLTVVGGKTTYKASNY